MNRKLISSIAIATAALLGANAYADTAPISRAQVRAELASAIRSGDLPAGGETSLNKNELNPGQYAAPSNISHITRAQVKADLANAQRTGDVPVGGEISLKKNELYPARYATVQAPSQLTRAQVKADLADALRRGDVPMGGETNWTRAAFAHRTM